MTTLATHGPVDVPARVEGEAGRPEWGSDLIVDLLRQLGIEYAATLPGNTFRGIHDSLVNYGGNRNPELILCNHEMISVAMARGYAKATGRPMAAIVHNVVGLLNTAMTIYDAWVDRAPVLILGGAEPADAARRRPGSGWYHTAHVQGNLVRGFTKWDDQPLSVEAIPEAVLRGYRIAVTEPAGPVYVCFDMLIQEQALPEGFRIPDVARYQPAKSPESERGAVQEVARLLVGAEMPLCLADRVGRDAAAVRTLVELAELLAMPVVNLGGRHSFPAPHALDFVGMQKALMREADVVLGLDVQDLEGATRTDGREGTDPTIASISLDEMSHRGMTLDCQALPAVDVPILGDTRLALPRLLDECQSLLDDAARERIERRRAALEPRQEQLRARHQRYLEEQWDHPQISEARLLAETWEAVKHEDFVFTLVRVQRMALGICELPGPERNIGLGGGGAVGSGPGVALGGALALKGTGKLPVAILGDGEFLSSIQALWTAAHYQIPSVWILNNNRSYFNDEDHQTRIAVARNRPPENKWIGERMENPAVDFTAVVKGFGLEAIGPVKEVADLPAALRRAVEIAKTGQLVVVDVWTENRPHG